MLFSVRLRWRMACLIAMGSLIVCGGLSQSNFPHKLPQELREFYQRVNGFELSWNVGINDCVFPVGAISINSIEKLKAAPVAHLTQVQLPGRKFVGSRMSDTLPRANAEQATKAASNAIVASFVIEELEQGAKVLVALRQQSGPVETTEVKPRKPAKRAAEKKLLKKPHNTTP